MKIQFLSRRNHFNLLCKELVKYNLDCEIIDNKKARNFLTLPTRYYINSIHSDTIVSHNPYHGLRGAAIAKKRKKVKNLVFRLKANHWIEQKSKTVPLKNRFGYKIKRYQYEKSLADIDLVLSISEYMKKEAEVNELERPIYVMYNGVDLTKFQEQQPIKKHETDLLCVMNLDIPEKISLLKDFIDAFKQERLDLKTTFLGDGPYRNEIQKYVDNKGLSQIVKFKGHVHDPESYYSSSKIVIHPSNLESFGMTLLEAGATSKPVIATNVGAIPEIIIHGETGYLTDHVEDFIPFIQNLMANETLRKKIGENAKARINEKFTWEKSAKTFVEILKKEDLL
ncbi:MAG: glycosyltransferase family 4 protein [Candidatus Bathyarchaeota archaeon]|nr:glycosyltransferase family 4 protein [Candidatus Bathyarchaeota archaeon]